MRNGNITICIALILGIHFYSPTRVLAGGILNKFSKKDRSCETHSASKVAPDSAAPLAESCKEISEHPTVQGKRTFKSELERIRSLEENTTEVDLSLPSFSPSQIRRLLVALNERKLSNLAALHLRGVALDKQSIVEITKMENLETLDLEGSSVGDKDLVTLLGKSPPLTQKSPLQKLKNLNLAELKKLTHSSVELLVQNMDPKLEPRRKDLTINLSEDFMTKYADHPAVRSGISDFSQKWRVRYYQDLTRDKEKHKAEHEAVKQMRSNEASDRRDGFRFFEFLFQNGRGFNYAWMAAEQNLSDSVVSKQEEGLDLLRLTLEHLLTNREVSPTDRDNLLVRVAKKAETHGEVLGVLMARAKEDQDLLKILKRLIFQKAEDYPKLLAELRKRRLLSTDEEKGISVEHHSEQGALDEETFQREHAKAVDLMSRFRKNKNLRQNNLEQAAEIFKSLIDGTAKLGGHAPLREVFFYQLVTDAGKLWAWDKKIAAEVYKKLIEHGQGIHQVTEKCVEMLKETQEACEPLLELIESKQKK